MEANVMIGGNVCQVDGINWIQNYFKQYNQLIALCFLKKGHQNIEKYIKNKNTDQTYFIM